MLAVAMTVLVAGAVIALLVGVETASPHTLELVPILMLVGGVLALVRAVLANAADGPVPIVGGVALIATSFVARHDHSGKAPLLGFVLFALATAAGKSSRMHARIAGAIAALAPLLVVADVRLIPIAGGLYLLFPISFAIDSLRRRE